MEINTPPSGVPSLQTSLTPQPLCWRVEILWRHSRGSLWHDQRCLHLALPGLFFQSFLFLFTSSVLIWLCSVSSHTYCWMLERQCLKNIYCCFIGITAGLSCELAFCFYFVVITEINDRKWMSNHFENRKFFPVWEKNWILIVFDRFHHVKSQVKATTF